ncbi:MAG: crossover junction endodeoxyribonuclease RuvC [Chloroherpetonaceae bacterium]|nr:crossover junction endodeoxyribonuclease RuvC [Chloroherpetonaceae bacterium]
MTTLGIDPGTLFTGFGVVERDGKTFRAVDFGVIATNPNDEMPKRLKRIYDELSRVIETHKPQRVALETAFYGKNAQSALKLGQARGAAMILAMNYALPISEYAPREVKKAITGNGNAAKAQVEFMAKKLLSLETETARADAFDALAIALCDAFSLSPPRQTEPRRPAPKAKTWKAFLDANPHLIASQ